MCDTSKTEISPKERHSSRFYFVQPIHSRLMINNDNPVCDYFNAKYLSYSSDPTSQTDSYSKPKFTKVCESCINPIFQTNEGFEICPCGKAAENRLHSVTEIQRLSSQKLHESEDDEKKKSIQVRSSSCDTNYHENFRKDRRVSILVDELLLKIYGGRDRMLSSGGTDFRDNVDYSTDSSNSIVSLKSNVLFRDKRLISGITRDKCQKWNELIRARLMCRNLNELKTMKKTLEYNISYAGSQLIRQLKRRDLLYSRRDAHCDVLTAFLQATSPKRSEDTKMQFSMKPNAGESGFQQWHSAMKMVARLPGGIPHEFRKTLWLTLAERHISSKKINWNQVERTCFNDTTNPDDEELGVQIVKDLHRTGCSLFCGTSGEQNQAVLKRVLLAYARWNKSVGYCQGFNMLAALILEVMDRCEYDSLKVMIYLIEGVLPESYFANSLRGLSIDMAVFRDLLRLKLPELSKHLEQLQTGSNDTGNTYEPPLTNVFTMQWFLTLFCNCLPHSTVLRVWDLVFLEGNQVLLKTALAIWDTLSDRIMPVKSADEFYTVMGVLTREMLEFGLMDANSLIKTITIIELCELTELRERYIYNITPWTQVARKGLRLFYSDDEMDDSDEDQNDDKAEGAYGFLKAATKHGSQSIRSISPSSILSPFASEKEKIALDISALKKQYSKIKERQRQAQIIFTAACNTHGLMGSMVPSTQSPAINHLLLSKTPNAPKNQKVQKQPPISRAVQRLKESSSSIGDETSKDRGETVYWDKRTKKKKRRRRGDVINKSTESKDVENHVDSDSSSSSYSSASLKSSTSTELCDDLTEFDSDNTSLSEYGSSPVCRIQSPSLSLNDDDKPETEAEEEKHPEDKEVTLEYNEGEHILNVLLTTSILVNEQMNQQESADIEQPVTEETFPKRLPSFDNLINRINNEDVKIDDPVCDTQIESYFQRDTNCDGDDVSQTNRDEHVSEHVPDELETALEHMKIDALEILFSSSTLESIRNENLPQDENFINFDVPIIISEAKSDISPVDKSEISCQLTSLTFDDPSTENVTGIELDTTISDQGNTPEVGNVLVDLSTQSYLCSDDRSISHDQMNSYDKIMADFVPQQIFESDSICSFDKTDNETFDFNDFQTKSSAFSNDFDKSNDLLDFTDSTLSATELCSNSVNWNPQKSFVCDQATLDGATNESCSNSPLKDVFDNFNFESFPKQESHLDELELVPPYDPTSTLPSDSDYTLQSYLPESEKFPKNSCENSNEADNFNNTETALENILRENTEVLKRVNKYASSQSCDFDSVSYRDTTSSDGERDGSILPRSRLKTKDAKFSSLDYPHELKKRPRRKHKSLDSLNTKNSKLNIGLVSKNCKWISISIDNSDLAQFNLPPEPNKIPKSEYNSDKISSSENEFRDTDNRKKNDRNSDIHLNFDIIATKKKKDPIQEYVHKKNVLSQNFKSPELSPLNFNPFPSRSNSRPPKELGIKLGLYSSNKK